MPTSRKAIAAIDDGVGIRGAVSRLLSALGYDTELYASARDYLDANRHGLPTFHHLMTEVFCLIVDIHIGESCGIELAQHLGRVGRRIPVIFMCAGSDESVQRRAREIGCAAFLTKPFTADVLMDALASIPVSAPLQFRRAEAKVE